jgi:hypothetical protein
MVCVSDASFEREPGVAVRTVRGDFDLVHGVVTRAERALHKRP